MIIKCPFDIWYTFAKNKVSTKKATLIYKREGDVVWLPIRKQSTCDNGNGCKQVCFTILTHILKKVMKGQRITKCVLWDMDQWMADWWLLT